MSKRGWADDDPDDWLLPWDDEPVCGYCHKPSHGADECPEDEGDGLTDAERWGPVPT